MKKKLKLLYCITALALVVLVTLGVSGCKKKAPESEEESEVMAEISSGEEVDENETEPAKNAETGEKEKEEPSEDKAFTVKEPILSPESAVEIYMAYKDLWMENPQFPPMAGYAYCLLDLDCDGVLELVNNLVDGSMRLSTNKIFRIDPESLTVETVELASENEMEGIDYYLSKENSKLLKNRSTGKLFYVFSDYTRVSMDEAGEVFFENYMKNGKMYQKELSFEYWNASGKEYTFLNEKVSEAEYQEKYDAYYKENKDLNLTWEYVPGEEFDEAQADEQAKMLLSAYKKFSCDGFSFDQVETYDAKLKKGKDLPKVATHYYSAVKDNFAKGYEPRLVLNEDGTFILMENLAEGMGTYRGTYRVFWNRLQLQVSETDFSGFAGDDVKLISFIINDADTLTLNTELCLSYPGDEFSTATP